MSEIIKLDFTNVTKDNYKAMATQLAEVVEQGLVNSLDAYTRLKAIEAMVSEARKLIDASAKVELSKYDKSEKVVFNAYEVTQREAGVSYDYSACNDEYWNLLNEQKNVVADTIKQRESFLKTIKEPMNIVTDNGEAVTIYPPVKKSTTSIVCS
jgi:hypothetical protein